MAIDERLLQVTIDIDGDINSYSGLAITAQGARYKTPTQGISIITIANLSKDVTNKIISRSSPFKTNDADIPINIILEAGRQSSGLSTVYEGNIYRSYETQPPDSVLHITAQTADFTKQNIVSVSAQPIAQLKDIAEGIAKDLGYSLLFEANDKQISNYNFTGPALRQLDLLKDLSDDIDVYIDANELVVKNSNSPLKNNVIQIRPNDIVGRPEITERGLKITILATGLVRVGAELDVISIAYPNASGRWDSYRITYHLTNRDIPFYYIIEATRKNGG